MPKIDALKVIGDPAEASHDADLHRRFAAGGREVRSELSLDRSIQAIADEAEQRLRRVCASLTNGTSAAP